MENNLFQDFSLTKEKSQNKVRKRDIPEFDEEEHDTENFLRGGLDLEETKNPWRPTEVGPRVGNKLEDFQSREVHTL